jgi:SPP1 gp7 family putative phage head morphogenesis protein
LLLRRAVRAARMENATVRAVRQAWRTATVQLGNLVRASGVLTGKKPDLGIPAPHERDAVFRLLHDCALIIQYHVARMSLAMAKDLPAFAELEFLELPKEIQAVLNTELATLHEETFDDPLIPEQPITIAFNAVPSIQAAELLASPLGGAFFQTSFGNLGTAALQALQRALLTGLVTGQAVPSVARNVQAVLQNKLWQAERIVRSEFVRVAGQAASMTYADNADVLRGVKWIATLDKRTCQLCGSLDGKVWTDIKKAKLPVTSTHPSCFVPETQVEGEFVAGARFLYEGPVVRIMTRQGHSVTVTPNHPVLTASGMRPAHLLDKGDYLACRSLRVSGPHNNEEDIPPSIEQVFNTISLAGRHAVYPRSGEDFHGDAEFGQSHVDVIALDLDLLLYDEAGLSQVHRNFVFPQTAVAEPAHLSFGSPNLLCQRHLTPARSLPRFGELSLDLLPRERAPFQFFSIGPVPNFNTMLTEAVVEHGTADPTFSSELLHRHAASIAPGGSNSVEGHGPQTDTLLADPFMENLLRDASLPRQLVNRCAGEIVLDEVVEVRYEHFSGHVYDLQSVSGVLVAGGIITSNCRCVLVPVVKSSQALGLSQVGPRTRASFSGQVPASQNYRQWFTQQDAEFQREVLGPTRYNLYTQGRVSFGDFATPNGVRSVHDLLNLAKSRAQ